MAKRKSVNLELIDRKACPEPYRLLDSIREDFHPALKKAQIALAWKKGWRADRDGRLILGQCRKAADLQRELAPYDFVILLNHEAWREFTVDKKKALLDHELCHAAPLLDTKTGLQKQDERGRLLWRIRKHDIEEFREIVQRHGCYKADLQAFAEAVIEAKQAQGVLLEL